MKNDQIIKGSTAFVNGKFIDDDGMKFINEKLRRMKLLFDGGPCNK